MECTNGRRGKDFCTRNKTQEPSEEKGEQSKRRQEKRRKGQEEIIPTNLAQETTESRGVEEAQGTQQQKVVLVLSRNGRKMQRGMADAQTVRVSGNNVQSRAEQTPTGRKRKRQQGTENSQGNYGYGQRCDNLI